MGFSTSADDASFLDDDNAADGIGTDVSLSLSGQFQGSPHIEFVVHGSPLVHAGETLHIIKKRDYSGIK
jgi:hypothetical protein